MYLIILMNDRFHESIISLETFKKLLKLDFTVDMNLRNFLLCIGARIRISGVCNL